MIMEDEKYRKEHNIITIDEIKEILDKYKIGKKPLSKLLGWGEVTVIRYLDGQMPERVYSDTLLKILDNPYEMEKLLDKNKCYISNVAYTKSKEQIRVIKSKEDLVTINLVAKHIIAKVEDISVYNLQRLLYFIQGFSYALNGKMIFDDKSVGYSYGPVYRSILNRFSYYKHDGTSRNEFSNYTTINLKENEKEIIESVIKYLGCYNGKVVEKITKKTFPWLKTREGALLDENATKTIYMNDIENYFINTCKEYKITRANDICVYAIENYKKIIKEL